jgi:PAS domain S-box-containing protein
MRQSRSDRETFLKLRDKAEQTMASLQHSAAPADGKDVDLLLQELQVHQIELEMQNDELRSANEQLEHQQIRFSGIYDLAPIGYLILDQNGLIEEVNNAGLTLLGNLRGRLQGKRLITFVAEEHRDDFYRFYGSLLTTRQRQVCQLKMIAGDEHAFFAQIEGTAIQPLANTPLQCYLAIVDITERIEAEQRLAENKERLELALEAASAGTWELDMETMAFYLDEFNYRICAVPGNSFDGKYQTFINLIHPDDRELVDQHFRIALNYEQPVDISCRTINAEGKLCYAAIRGHRVSEQGRNSRFVGIMLDVTSQVKLEAEAARLKEDQQKNITLATLKAGENERRRISDALHDGVSQLLYGIKMKLDLLDKFAKDPILSDLNDLLTQTITETRNISFELAPAILTDFGLPATIDELAKRLSTPRMRISARLSGLETRGDIVKETIIFRIIQELVNNCMKHSGATQVLIEIKKNKIKGVSIIVKDNGQGFDHKQQEQKPGGAGLSSIKNRLSLYNGTLQIKSESGKGTQVNIALPDMPQGN